MSLKYPTVNGRLTVAALFLLAAGLAVFLIATRRGKDPMPRTETGWRATVTTLAGDGSPAFQDGGAKGDARFSEPFGLALDGAGNLYVADAGENNRIRKLTPQGVVTTLAGGAEGFADGAGASASFNTPSALALDGAGNLYVADTGNNRIRKVTPGGVVTTLAGTGAAGYADGPAASARFNSPVGVAVDSLGNVFVADTYNDRIRVINTGGEVRTIAGAGMPGYMDGAAQQALFNTPCGVAVSQRGEIFVADTGNNRLRKLTTDGQVVTVSLFDADGTTPFAASEPVGLALTADSFIYMTELDRGRVTQIAPDGTVRLIAGLGSGFADGDGHTLARFNQPASLALDASGALYVADAANYLIRKLTPAGQATGDYPRVAADAREVLPRLSAESLGIDRLPWPLAPQDAPHEVIATMGEVRGSFTSRESRHHLHSGIDIFGTYGETVRVVREEKVSSPLPNWGFGTLNEGLRVGLIAYIHLRVGRNEHDEMLADGPFAAVRDAQGKVAHVRLKRGTRLRTGDALGTINRMYHVHMNFGPPGAEVNPLMLPLVGFADHVAPKIERDGIQLFEETGARLTNRRDGRLVVPRNSRVRIVVDAYDQVDGNQARRRLGLYRAGYQLLRADGAPAEGFADPRITIEFKRLPPDQQAVRIAYADQSGITVYGNASTEFFYEVTNIVRDGQAQAAWWNAGEMPAGDYILRIFAADYAGNEATEGRDLPIIIE